MIFKKINRFIATGAYSGYLPKAPGTWGSLLALILIIIWPILLNWQFVFLITILGFISSELDGQSTGIKDDSKVVIDEIAGMLIVFTISGLTYFTIILGFIIFRILDIKKPFFINSVQKFSGGIGVMLDDILAGIIAGVIIKIILMI